MNCLITGATGQVAAYLAEHLLEKGHQVYLSDRDSSIMSHRFWRLEELGIKQRVTIVHASLDSYDSLISILLQLKPDYVFHTAANSFVGNSFLDEFSCFQVNLQGSHRLLRACLQIVPECKFLFMGSSEQFGAAKVCPQNEETEFNPRNSYGIAKTAAYSLVKYYRNHHGMFACSAISYNEESPLRSSQFVSRKITKGAVEAIHGGPKIKLGNLLAIRDFGYTKDFVVALLRMVEQKYPQDFVLATGVTHTINDFLSEAFSVLSQIEGKDFKPEQYIEFDLSMSRPHEQFILRGDATKARSILGWKPKTDFKQLVAEMVQADYNRAKAK